MNTTTLAVVSDLIVAVAVIVAATVLLALNKIDSTTAMALFTAGIGMIGGGTKAAVALRVPAPSQSVSPPPPPAG